MGVALLTHTNVDSADCRVHCILCEATLQVKCKQQQQQRQQQRQQQQYALHGQGRRVWLLGLANARHALGKYCGGVNREAGRRGSAKRVLFAIIACWCVCAGPDNPSQPKCHNTTQFSHQQQQQQQQRNEELVSAAGVGAGAGAGPATGPLNKSQLIEF